MDINLFDILIVASLAQGIVFGLVLLFSPLFKGEANAYLAGSLIVLSIIGLDEWLSSWDFDKKYYFIDYFGDDVPWILWVCVPIFFFFLKSLKHPIATKRLLYLLSTPFFLFILFNLIINFQYDFHWYDFSWMKSFRYWVYRIEFYLAPVFGLILTGLSLSFILRAKNLPENKTWLIRIWSAWIALVLLWLVLDLIPSGLDQWDSILFSILWLSISLFIYWISFKGLYQFRLANDREAIQQLMHRKGTSKALNINEKQAKRFDSENSYLQELDRLLVEEQIFLDPDLNRDQVAEKLGISSGYLSQVINQATGNNFAHYINSFRVEEIKERLKDPDFDRFSLLAIGLDTGFKSKSAFYTSFKKFTGMTPKEFKERLQ